MTQLHMFPKIIGPDLDFFLGGGFDNEWSFGGNFGGKILLKQSTDSSLTIFINWCYSGVKNFSISIFLYFFFILMKMSLWKLWPHIAKGLIYTYTHILDGQKRVF